MKKLFSVILMVFLAFSLSACATPENRLLSDDLETLLTELINAENLSEDAIKFLSELSIEEVKGSDKVEWHLGSDDIRFDRAVTAVPAMATTPFELTLVRANANQDVNNLKDNIETHANPLKWVSFTVDPENVIVDNIGDVIILIMSDNYLYELHEAFERLEDKYVPN